MNQVLVGAALAALAFGLSYALCWVARIFAERLGFLDRPGGRKAHAVPTPLGGGVAFWASTMIVLGLGALFVVFGADRLPEELARHVGGLRDRAGTLALLMVLATLIMFMGLADDRRGLSWRLRLGVQVGLATTLVASGVRITLFPPFSHPLVAGALSVLWIAALTNAFNFLDNMDGLAGGVALIASLLLAAALVAVGGLFVPAVLLTLAGALGGFLVHNRYPARLFMGDAGSNFLGFLLGGLTILGTFTRSDAPMPEGVPLPTLTPSEAFTPYGVLTPLFVMAVPLYDMVSVIVIRLREGRSPFQGDRRHFSHRLVDKGLTPPRAVRTIYLVTLAIGLGALLLHRLDAAGLALLVAQTACLLGVVAVLEAS